MLLVLQVLHVLDIQDSGQGLVQHHWLALDALSSLAGIFSTGVATATPLIQVMLVLLRNYDTPSSALAVLGSCAEPSIPCVDLPSGVASS